MISMRNYRGRGSMYGCLQSLAKLLSHSLFNLTEWNSIPHVVLFFYYSNNRSMIVEQEISCLAIYAQNTNWFSKLTLTSCQDMLYCLQVTQPQLSPYRRPHQHQVIHPLILTAPLPVRIRWQLANGENYLDALLPNANSN